MNGSRTRDVYVFYTHFSAQYTDIELPGLVLLAITAFGHGLFRKARESPSLRTTERNFTVLCDDGHDKSREGVKPQRDMFLNRHSRIRINIRRKSKGRGV